MAWLEVKDWPLPCFFIDARADTPYVCVELDPSMVELTAGNDWLGAPLGNP